jgi:hypothetical protein
MELKKPTISLDIDWAPDIAIDFVANMLQDHKIKATWFVTHNSPSIQKLKKNNLFELGIHPNFLEGSTQGDSPSSILNNLKKIIPCAKSIRSHNSFQSTPILKEYSKFGLENECSILLEHTPNIIPYYSKFYDLYRFYHFWEDDIFLFDKKNWRDTFDTPGLKIFDFHPIHIYLNSKNMKNYKQASSEIGLENISENNIQKFINKTDIGILKEFNDVLKELEQYETLTIMDQQNVYRKRIIFEK